MAGADGKVRSGGECGACLSEFSHHLRRRLTARVAPTLHERLPAAGGRGLSCEPGCAVPAAIAPSVSGCTPSMTSSAKWGCGWTFFLFWPFSCRPSRRVGRDDRSAVAAGHLVFVHQSAGLEHPGLSLERDFIRETVMESTQCVGVFLMMTLFMAAGTSGAVREVDFAASCGFARFQS